jgi:hypothetical protein
VTTKNGDNHNFVTCVMQEIIRLNNLIEAKRPAWAISPYRR